MNDRRRLIGAEWAALAFALAAASLFYYGAMDGYGLFGGHFPDTDDHTRALRVLDLMTGGPWFNPVLQRVGDGLVSHWTRPSDLVVLIGAWPLHVLAGFTPERAIEIWATLSPVVLLAGLVAAWWWAVAPLARDEVERRGQALSIIAMPSVWGWYLPGRIDHSGLIVVVAVLLLGFSFRIVRGCTGRQACLAGLVAGFAIWVSPEQLLFVGCMVISCGIGWLLRGGPALTAANRSLAGGAALSVTVCCLLERGIDGFLGSIDVLDRISLFHSVLLSAVFAGWIVIERIGSRWPATTSRIERRAALGGVGAALAIAVVALFQPQVFHGFVATNVDPNYVRLRSPFISEGIEIVTLGLVEQIGLLRAAIGVVKHLLPALLGVLALGWLLVRTRDKERASWVALAVWAAVFLLWQGNPNLMNAEWLNLFGVTAMVPALCRLIADWPSSVRREVWCAVGVALIGFVAPLIPEQERAIVAHPLMVASNPDNPGSCPVEAVVDTVIAAGQATGPTVVMTVPDLGPEILWRTPHAVLSIPNHHVQPGFGASYKAFTAPTDAEARAIVEKTGTGIVALCDYFTVRPFFGLIGEEDSFGKRLMDGRHPDWLEPVEPSDPETALDFRVFRVVR